MFRREARGCFNSISVVQGKRVGILVGAHGLTGIGENEGDKISLSHLLPFCPPRHLIVETNSAKWKLFSSCFLCVMLRRHCSHMHKQAENTGNCALAVCVPTSSNTGLWLHFLPSDQNINGT